MVGIIIMTEPSKCMKIAQMMRLRLRKIHFVVLEKIESRLSRAVSCMIVIGLCFQVFVEQTIFCCVLLFYK